MNTQSTTNQTSEFLIFFGHDRILDKVFFTSLSQVMEAISDNLFMFTNDNFQFSEKSITVELLQTSEKDDYLREILFKISASKFNLIKKMNLSI